MPTTSEKLIHIKFNHSEAVQSKRDILSSQANLLRIVKTTKEYQSLRTEELKLKIRLNRKIKELLTSMRKLQTIPKIKIPEVLQKNYEENIEDEEKITNKIKQTKNKTYDKDIESQLADIKEKLRNLG